MPEKFGAGICQIQSARIALHQTCGKSLFQSSEVAADRRIREIERRSSAGKAAKFGNLYENLNFGPAVHDSSDFQKMENTFPVVAFRERRVESKVGVKDEKGLRNGPMGNACAI
jgi:hypothetical protein